MSQQGYLYRQGPAVGLLPMQSFGFPMGHQPDIGGPDFWPTARGGVADLVLATTAESDAMRHRRRLDAYRRQHNTNAAKFDNWTNAVDENEKQKTEALWQRWLASRNKRTAPTTSSSRSKSLSSSSRGEPQTLMSVTDSVGDDTPRLIIPKAKRRATSDGHASLGTAKVASKTSALNIKLEKIEDTSEAASVVAKTDFVNASCNSSKTVGQCAAPSGNRSEFVGEQKSKVVSGTNNTGDNSCVAGCDEVLNDINAIDLLGDFSTICQFIDGSGGSESTDFLHILNEEPIMTSESTTTLPCKQGAAVTTVDPEVKHDAEGIVLSTAEVDKLEKCEILKAEERNVSEIISPSYKSIGFQSMPENYNLSSFEGSHVSSFAQALTGNCSGKKHYVSPSVRFSSFTTTAPNYGILDNNPTDVGYPTTQMVGRTFPYCTPQICIPQQSPHDQWLYQQQQRDQYHFQHLQQQHNNQHVSEQWRHQPTGVQIDQFSGQMNCSSHIPSEMLVQFGNNNRFLQQNSNPAATIFQPFPGSDSYAAIGVKHELDANMTNSTGLSHVSKSSPGGQTHCMFSERQKSAMPQLNEQETNRFQFDGQCLPYPMNSMPMSEPAFLQTSAQWTMPVDETVIKCEQMMNPAEVPTMWSAAQYWQSGHRHHSLSENANSNMVINTGMLNTLPTQTGMSSGMQGHGMVNAMEYVGDDFGLVYQFP